MSVDRRVFAGLAGCACAVLCALAPNMASASSGGLFGPLSAQGPLTLAPMVSGSGSVEFGGEGEGAGQFTEPRGVAVDQQTGDVYVVDNGYTNRGRLSNARIDEFSSSGVFIRAWGWGVNKEKPEAALQECTPATGCQKGETGGGAGQFEEADGIAIDSQAGKEAVYVLENGNGNDRVQEFTLEGEFVRMWGGKVNKKGGNVCTAAEASECQVGSEGVGNGEFRDPGLQGAIAVSSNGDLYVGDYRRVQWFSPTGSFEGSFAVAAVNQVEALTVTSAGKICLTVNESTGYTQESPPTEVRCYSAAGSPEHMILLEEKAPKTAGEVKIALAADSGGHLFVDEYVRDTVNEQTTQDITEYGTGFEELKRFRPPGGIAALPSSEEAANRLKPGGLALTESGKTASGVVVGFASEDLVRGEPLPPPGPYIESVEGVPGEPASLASLTASINPENHPTTYRFEYGAEPASETSSASFVLKASGFKPEMVRFALSGLVASSVYHFHVVAENVEGTVESEDETFETLPALRVDTVSASAVSGESATLEAMVDPLGSESEYWFEYAAGGEAEHATAVGTVPAQKGDVPVSVEVKGLRPSAVYSYRLVAKNTLGEAQREARLTTQPAGAPFTLLDGRGWEQVSPVRKGVANITLGASRIGQLQSSPRGEALTYEVYGYPEENPEGELIVEPAQVVSRHGPSGWSTKDIAAPNVQRPSEARIGESGEYRLFSADLQRSLLEPSPYTPLSEWTTERTAYLRDEAKCAAIPPLAPGSECFVPLVTSKGPYADVNESVKFGGPLGQQADEVRPVGATPDFTHVVLLTKEIELLSGMGKEGLYEWASGRLAPISLTPAGVACEGESVLGAAAVNSELGRNQRDALSTDGTLAVFSTTPGSGVCSGHLYIRDVASGVTVQLDEVQGGSGAGTPDAVYEDASVGDERIFFTDTQPLTKGASATQAGVDGAARTAADLYEYHFDRASDSGGLTDMTVPVNAGEAAGVLSVLGVSEDGADVYAVATGVLTTVPNTRGESAVSGGDNLYLLESSAGGRRAVFVATLSTTDEPDLGPGAKPGGLGLIARQTSRVSPNGHWLAFMSDRSLTGYDNEDVSSKFPGERMDEEVFLYDAGSNRLVCASCDPTGARPSGMLINDEHTPPLVDREQVWEGRWVSGLVPVRYAIGIGGELGVHQPRYLSNGGRLFFDSTDGLVSRDGNGRVDAYEYEPPVNDEAAAGDTCTVSSAMYSPAAEGCVDLVSGGGSLEESVFIEASENGNDVFSLTAEKLVPGDTDSAYDVYDAHVCGSGWACPAPAAVSPPCAGTESCRGASAPQPSAYGAPASATFTGAGNPAFTAPSTGPGAKPRALTRAQRLAAALKACRRDKNRRKRVVCERLARKRYGPKRKGKRSSARGARTHRGREVDEASRV